MWQGMTEEVKQRLEGFGVDVTELDLLIEQEAVRAYNYVLGICNLEIMPEVLKPVCVDFACSGIIRKAGAEGSLSLVGEAALTSLKEGDVTLGFDRSGTQNLITGLLEKLDFNDKSLLLSFRRLKW